MNGDHGGRGLDLQRIGWTELLSCPASTSNVSLSPSGSILVRTDGCLHVVHLADGFAPSQSGDSGVRHYDDVTKRTKLFRTTIPISATLAKSPFPPQKTKAITDLLPYDARFIDAQWCPLEIGMLSSPIFTALTTKRTLHVFHSTNNHLNGPYDILACVNEDVEDESFKLPLASFTWLQPSEKDRSQRTIFLIGATTTGNILVWKIQHSSSGPLVTEHASLLMNVGAAYRVSSSYPEDQTGERYLALASIEQGLQVYRVHSDGDEPKLNFAKVNVENPIPAGARITLMAWRMDQLVFTTAGAVHLLSLPTGQHSTKLLGSVDGDEPALYLQAPAGLHWREERRFDLILQDGSVYPIDFRQSMRTAQKRRADGSTRDIVQPISTVAAPVELIADEQRKVERLRGLYAYVEDGCGMSFLCYDANEIAEWSYLLNMRCSLEPAFTQAIHTGRYVERAQAIVSEMLQGNDRSSARTMRLRQQLTFVYSESEDGHDVIKACLSQVDEAHDNVSDLNIHAAISIVSWIKTLDGLQAAMQKQAKALFTSLQRASVQFCIGSVVYQPAFSMNSSSIARYALIERQILILAASALVAFRGSVEGDKEVDQDAAYLRLATTAKGSGHGGKLVKEWIRLLDHGKELDVGERCAVCDAPVTVNASTLLQATCKNGHPWRRCSTTRSLLTDVQALECIVCGAQTMIVKQATNELQRAMLERAERCTICDGAFIQI